jgi:hypothetical protein
VWARSRGGDSEVVGLLVAVHTSGDRTRLDFLFSAAVILGMCASYKRMAVGAHYPEDWGRPDQGAREGGAPDSILDWSGLRSN